MDGIDTKYMSENGTDAYNLAMGGVSLETNYVQLEEYLNTYEYKPKLIILGLGAYMNNLEKEGLINPIVDYTMDKSSSKLEIIPMLKFKYLFEEQLKKLFSKTHREAYLINGQLRFSKKVSDNTTLNFSNKFPFEEYTNSILLKEITNLCSSHDINLIIVEMLGFKNVRHPSNFKSEYLDKDKKNGLIIDLNYIEFGNKFDDDEDWIGNNHLNVYGAKKFTKELLDIVGRKSQ
jgi:hypothetical protein